MRREASYPAQRYNDPEDRRLTQIIRPAKGAKEGAVNMLGVPFDGAVLGRKGAAKGPSAIREAMAGFSNYNVELGIGLEGAKVYDLGDLEVDNDDVTNAHRQIESEVADDILESSLLVVLGGDNSISLPSIKAMSKKFRKIGLVVIDSHFDLRDPVDGKPTSGSSYGLALEEIEGLRPERVVEVGIHGFLNSRSYYDKARKLGIRIVTADEVRKRGPRVVASEAFKIAAKDADAVYLSVDLDSVDLSQVSGVSAPSAGGVSAQELLTVVFEVARHRKVKLADIVELAPTLDPAGVSKRVAASVLTYLIAGYVSRR